ncbi:hypothetical protein [Streptomyces sp. CA-253872]|uniref:hypothetical protein n=1 Tax=Streptomyces sp. CA-253872 TaxID=3240067 RepID=UPI003D922EE6
MGTVPNDELSPGERGSGPRHAAPRKSVLTKFRIPAGKAMALAAMPTAVFVGMGLTPRLALADDKTDLPFAPGPCVTRSDEPSQEPSGSASAKPSPSPSASASTSPSPSTTPRPTASDEAKDEAKGDAAKDEAKDDAAKDASGSDAAGNDKADTGPGAKSAKEAQDEPSASPSPSTSEKKNPLDPLGLGDALKDLFTPKDKKAEDTDASGEEKTAEDEKTADTKADDKAADDKAGDKAGDSAAKDSGTQDSGTKDAAGGDTSGGAAAPRTLKDDLSDAARAAGASEKDIAEGARKAEEQNAKGPQTEKAGKADAGTSDGPEPYPCPTHDAKALADADVDESYPRVAEDPWTLHTTKLSLHGLGYDGIVKVRTSSGRIKNVLKFTASGIDIKDLHQTAVGPGEYTTHVKGAPGSTSKIRDGKVTMYTEELKGKLLGLIPVDFTPDSPPPLTLPELFFTDVTVVQAGQFGGTLTIPGLHNYLDKSGS